MHINNNILEDGGGGGGGENISMQNESLGRLQCFISLKMWNSIKANG